MKFKMIILFENGISITETCESFKGFIDGSLSISDNRSSQGLPIDQIKAITIHKVINKDTDCFGMRNPRQPDCQKCDKGDECKKATDKSMSEPIEGVHVTHLGPEFFEDLPRNDPNDICPFFKDNKCTAYSPEFGEEVCPPNKQLDYLRCIVYYDHIDDYNQQKQEEAENTNG